MKTETTGTLARDEQRWSAVRSRATAVEHRFVYAVQTTGVYCRPGCSSRLPNRKNVVFFDHAWQAKAAGYRACKRCRPAEGERQDKQAVMVDEACRLIDQAPDPPRLDQLAEAVGYSPSHFHRTFKKLTGVTPRAYAAQRRIERAQKELRDGPTVSHAIYASGYGASSRFYEDTTSAIGMTPSEFRRGAVGQSMRVAITSCDLGLVLVAATDKGICAIELGDAKAELRARLRARFPKARFAFEDGDFNGWVGGVVLLLESPDSGHSLPLDIQGTAFQRRVWDALRAIPPGKTMTYSEIAAGIGQPKASRAVASACAANLLAVAVPCHRVARSDGKLGGYRWGVDRKRALVEREAHRGRHQKPAQRSSARACSDTAGQPGA